MLEKKPNWLLRGFIFLSLLVHLYLFYHIAEIYQNNTPSYIELSLRQFSRPDVRNIPRPRPRMKAAAVPGVQALKPEIAADPNIEREEAVPDRVADAFEKVTMPELPEPVNAGDYSAPVLPAEKKPLAESALIQSKHVLKDTPAENNGISETVPALETMEFASARDYFDLLQLQLQNNSKKTYPESAKLRKLEDHVKIQFVLQLDGRLTDIKILESSKHKKFNAAAIEAVKRTSPFIRPPPFILTKPIALTTTIRFEII
jgi:periplasmic protein TonB